MTNIFLFGSTTETGKFIKKNYAKYFKDGVIFTFSSNSKKDIFFDLKTSNYPKELCINEDTIIISLAPIWLFVPFLVSFLKKTNHKKIKAILITSSTSVLTKKYSWNKFDKELYHKLNYWEDKLKEIMNFYNLNIILIRPTLIYGNLGTNSDKNISLLVKLMRKSFFLPIPCKTGLRQPLHFSQLASSLMKIAKNVLNKEAKFENILTYNIGGDDEFSYERMLYKIKENFSKDDSIHYCKIIRIPSRLFLILCLPILIFSPKTYEAIQRLKIDMAGFNPSYKITDEPRKVFPVKSN